MIHNARFIGSVRELSGQPSSVIYIIHEGGGGSFGSNCLQQQIKCIYWGHYAGALYNVISLFVIVTLTMTFDLN